MSPLPFDLLADLEPVGAVCSQPQMIVGKKAFAGERPAGLVAWLKANPGKASAGSAGTGSAPHVCGLLFQAETGTQLPLRAVSRRRAGDAGPGRRARSTC